MRSRAGPSSTRSWPRRRTWIRQGMHERGDPQRGAVPHAGAVTPPAPRPAGEQTGALRMQIQDAERSGRLVIRAEGVSFSYGDQPVVRDFSTTLMRGDKVGIVGPNGSGKTTLLRLLLGELPPQAGTLRQQRQPGDCLLGRVPHAVGGRSDRDG